MILKIPCRQVKDMTSEVEAALMERVAELEAAQRASQRTMAELESAEFSSKHTLMERVAEVEKAELAAEQRAAVAEVSVLPALI